MFPFSLAGNPPADVLATYLTTNHSRAHAHACTYTHTLYIQQRFAQNLPAFSVYIYTTEGGEQIGSMATCVGDRASILLGRWCFGVCYQIARAKMLRVWVVLFCFSLCTGLEIPTYHQIGFLVSWSFSIYIYIYISSAFVLSDFLIGLCRGFMYLSIYLVCKGRVAGGAGTRASCKFSVYSSSREPGRQTGIKKRSHFGGAGGKGKKTDRRKNGNFAQLGANPLPSGDFSVHVNGEAYVQLCWLPCLGDFIFVHLPRLANRQETRVL
ncbi:hypothetical protein B0T24DRAFT_614137 [Lasiosphaeria ovina]|uniref:Uncharacterized protein n=1 Tax=Lasiosphaeria ovina TaxID=92902 RepID=A0AAE0NEM9_9PEZI|nr:hypothetical protein B0T24DRAFT_614137 [Lasiosphaeria ovina]